MSAKGLIDLAMDYASRMARAKEQGFDVDQVYYHGTRRQFDEFSIPDDGRFSLHGKGVYFAQDPKKVRFADQEGGNIVSAYTRGRMGSEADLRDAMEALGSRLSVSGHGARAELINNEMRARGFTGYRAGDQSIVFDPSNIRSVNAAFDPAKKDSSNLLASAGGLGLLGMAMSEDADAGALSGIKKISKKAEDFSPWNEEITYIDESTNGTLKLAKFSDGRASVLGLEVPKPFQGKGAGKRLQHQAMMDHLDLTGQVSSKKAATSAYNLGRRPPDNPSATINDVYAAIDEMSSVNLASSEAIKRINTTGSADPRLLAATALGTGTAVAAPKAKGIMSMIGDTALEAMSGVNRAAVDGANFLTTDQINAVLNLSGSDKRVPNLYGIPGIEGGTEGNYMEPGLLRQFVREASGLLSPI